MIEQLFNIDLNKTPLSSKKDKTNREKNLKLFLKGGLPNKKDENWKFTDLNFIINSNFKNISNDYIIIILIQKSILSMILNIILLSYKWII